MGYIANSTDNKQSAPRLYSVRGWSNNGYNAQMLANALSAWLLETDLPCYCAALTTQEGADALPDADSADVDVLAVWPWPLHTVHPAQWATLEGYIAGFCAAQYAHAECNC